MKNFITLFLTLVFFQCLNAQTTPQRSVVSFNAHVLKASQHASGTNDFDVAAEVPLNLHGSFLAYSVVWYTNDWENFDGRLTAEFFIENSMVESRVVSTDIHTAAPGRRQISELYFLEKDAHSFQVKYTGTASVDSISVHFYYPGTTDEAAATVPPRTQPENSLSDRSACSCPQPDYQDRNDWCPAGNCPPDPTPVPTTVGFLIVHHSAGTNTSTDWAAVVRSIWDYHVNVRGWDDIGYNWLVDPNGVLYEGRGDDKLGAHFCGTNGGTMGVCMMGDFTNVTPTASAIGRLEDLLAWKSCDVDIDPLETAFHPSSGLTIHRISGHRDGCATSCPGDLFYPLLPAIRQEVREFIDNGCELQPVDGPSQLTAALINYDQVQLDWLDNSDSEESYVLERSKSFNNNFQVIATLPANTIGFFDLDVEPQTGYFYRVKAMNGSTSSAYSNEVFIATGVTGTDENGLDEKSVVISPNPTASVIRISVENNWTGDQRFSVFDAQGIQFLSKSLVKTTADSKVSFNLEAYPAGIYWLKVEQGQHSAFFKIVKK